MTAQKLPTELLMEIMDRIYEAAETKSPAIMTPDAAWRRPYYGYDEPQTQAELKAKRMLRAEEEPEHWPTLKSLRLVCRRFCDVASPLLFQELDLDIVYRHTLEDLQAIDKHVGIYGQYVKAVRIHWKQERKKVLSGDESTLQLSSRISKALNRCRNAHTVAVYIASRKALDDFWPVQDEIVRMIEDGQVIHLGIYSTSIVTSAEGTPSSWTGGFIEAGMELLSRVASSKRAIKALQRLDIVQEDIEPVFYIDLWQKFTALRSLTIRRALRQFNRFMFTREERHFWARNDNLTSLRLMDCRPAHAAQMPLLVAHYRNLRELVWVLCGPSDWEEAPVQDNVQALLQDRKPLDVLVIEHTIAQEIALLGVIPVTDVTIANLRVEETVDAFQKGNLFPGIKALRILPAKELDPSNVEEDGNSSSLGTICKRRGISLQRNATILYPCTCCRSRR